MRVAEIPAVGDEFSYSVIVSRGQRSAGSSWAPEGHRELGRIMVDTPQGRKIKGYARECDPQADRSCPVCYDQWETRTSTVVKVQYWMDNSIEVVLADGARRQVEAPHGDVCF